MEKEKFDLTADDLKANPKVQLKLDYYNMRMCQIKNQIKSVANDNKTEATALGSPLDSCQDYENEAWQEICDTIDATTPFSAKVESTGTWQKMYIRWDGGRYDTIKKKNKKENKMISYHFAPKPPTDERKRVRNLVQELGLGVEDATRLFEEVKGAEKGTIEMRNHLAKHTNYEDIKGAKMIKIAKERLYPSVYRISEMDDDHKKKANPEYLRENEGLEACVIGDELVIADGNPSILTDVQKQTLSDAMGREFEIWENDTHILLGTSKSAVDTRMPPFTGALAITLFAMLGPMLYGYAVGSTHLVTWLNIHMLFGYAVLMIPTLVAMFLYSLVVFLWIMNRKDSEVMKRALGEKVFTRELLFKGK